MKNNTPCCEYKFVEFSNGIREEIPIDWNLCRVKEHVKILVGYSFPSSKYSNNTNDIKLVRGDNVTEGKIRWENKTRYWKNSSGLERFLLHEGDFVISMDGSKVGKNYAYITKNDVPSLLVQRVARLRTKKTLTQKYLGYIFGNRNFVNYVNSKMTNTAIPHISQNQIENFEFVLPTLKEEQEKIAFILSNLDNTIEVTNKIIEKYKKIKIGLMQKLLTRGIGPKRQAWQV